MVLEPVRRIGPQLTLVCALVLLSSGSAGAADIAELLARMTTPQAMLEHKPHPATPRIDPKTTRFLIGIEKEVEFQVFSLTNPNRVIVDLPEIKLRMPAKIGDKPVGLVKAFRGGLSAPGKSRIVIDVTEPVIVQSATITEASKGSDRHLAIDIVAVKPLETKTAASDTKPFDVPPFALGAAGLQPPLPAPATRPDVIAAKSFKPIIIIDPGHGGNDSGAKKNGIVEKEVVLAFSKMLRDKLEATGRYRVLMTRDKDVFVELSDRVGFAEKHKANLFIAVHADYARSSASGATVYSLRDSVARGLQRSTMGKVGASVLTNKEMETVKSAQGDIDIVKGFLSDLAEREVEATHDRTNVFTRSVIDFMGRSTAMRNDPDKQAAFRVLKTQKFPSVLIELAYVTNKEDAERLASDTWRDKVATSLANAVESYFTQQIALFPM